MIVWAIIDEDPENRPRCADPTCRNRAKVLIFNTETQAVSPWCLPHAAGGRLFNRRVRNVERDRLQDRHYAIGQRPNKTDPGTSGASPRKR